MSNAANFELISPPGIRGSSISCFSGSGILVEGMRASRAPLGNTPGPGEEERGQNEGERIYECEEEQQQQEKKEENRRRRRGRINRRESDSGQPNASRHCPRLFAPLSLPRGLRRAALFAYALNIAAPRASL